MSHKSTPYSPNFPLSQGYGPPAEAETPAAGYPMYPQANYAGTLVISIPRGHPMSMPQPTQMHVDFQQGFQPGLQSGYQPGLQPGFAPGLALTQGYPQPQGYPAPVIHQPAPQGAPDGLMTIPPTLSNCPPGLEYLSRIDKLLIHQKVEFLEVFAGFETNNKYTIKNSVGQKVYYAAEANDCCTRNCCGPIRPFEMKIMDNFQKEIIHIERPLACDSCCCPCWLQRMEVSSPPGTLIGTVEQEWSICKPCYVIKNDLGVVVLRIKGPLCTFSICGNVDFNIYAMDGVTKLGKISKQWSGLLREGFTDADYFGLTFPMDLDVKIKAVLLGACFLIDFMYFEKTQN